MKTTNFNEALKKLGIEEFADRIFNSNSHGELFHLMDYILMADMFSDKELFAELFRDIVKGAEKKWKRPESVFQHIPRLIDYQLTQLKSMLK